MTVTSIAASIARACRPFATTACAVALVLGGSAASAQSGLDTLPSGEPANMGTTTQSFTCPPNVDLYFACFTSGTTPVCAWPTATTPGTFALGICNQSEIQAFFGGINLEDGLIIDGSGVMNSGHGSLTPGSLGADPALIFRSTVSDMVFQRTFLLGGSSGSACDTSSSLVSITTDPARISSVTTELRNAGVIGPDNQVVLVGDVDVENAGLLGGTALSVPTSVKCTAPTATQPQNFTARGIPSSLTIVNTPKHCTVRGFCFSC